MEYLAFLSQWIQIIVPQPCFDKFFIELDFLDVPCLKLTVSKALGFVIILGSVLVKVPQIIKLVRAKSSVGISLLSLTLELIAVVSSVAYGYINKFPFSSYGDSLFLVLQTWIIAFLVLHYSGKTSAGLSYSSAFAAIFAFLLSPAAPQSLIWWLYAANLPNIVLARLIQIITNLRNSSTGQLSAVTVILIFLGAAARIFTSVQETGDTMMITQYVASAVLNGILTVQIFWYWNSAGTEAKRQKKRQ